MPSRRPDSEPDVIPVHEETASVRKRVVEGKGVRIDKHVHAHTKTVETTVRREQPVVERVSINRIVAEPPPVRQEGDTLIIPVLEEVAVVERRLMLREEIRIHRHEIVEPFRQDVTLRAEKVEVESLPRDDGATAPLAQTTKQGRAN